MMYYLFFGKLARLVDLKVKKDSKVWLVVQMPVDVRVDVLTLLDESYCCQCCEEYVLPSVPSSGGCH